MATQQLQLTGNVEALPMNSLDYDPTVTHTVSANANTIANTVGLHATNANTTQTIITDDTVNAHTANGIGLQAMNANTVQTIIADRDPKNQAHMQWKQNTRHWLTEFETLYGEGYRAKGQPHPEIAYDRKVPGGGADPGSGKIVQLEVPTTPGRPNPVADMLPFPSISVA